MRPSLPKRLDHAVIGPKRIVEIGLPIVLRRQQRPDRLDLLNRLSVERNRICDLPAGSQHIAYPMGCSGDYRRPLLTARQLESPLITVQRARKILTPAKNITYAEME